MYSALYKYFKLLSLGLLVLPASFVMSKKPEFTKKQLDNPPPKLIRTCCSFGVDLRMTAIPFVRKTAITSITKIGHHQYLGDKTEENGIVYTKRGGFIDIGHLRDCADWTAYLYAFIIENKKFSNQFKLDLASEGGDKKLVINLPENINDEELYLLAGQIAYDLSMWHEIATWFGSSYIPFVPERYSSFSPEDCYSNLMGVILGIKALKSDLRYEDAMTKLLPEMLYELQVVPTIADTYVAMNRVEEIWWTAKVRLPSRYVLLDRYFDDPSDEYLLPWIVPSEMDILPLYKLNKPKTTIPDLYTLLIDANYRFPLKAILSEEKRRDITQKDFGQFVDYIRKDVVKPKFRFSLFKK